MARMPDPPEPYFLTSARLGFRCWQADDLELAMSLWGDHRVTKLIDARGRLTREQVREKLHNEIRNQERHGVQYWPCFRLEDHELAGCCGLRPYDPDQGIYEIGMHIRAQYWRQGFAREACRAVMAHAFGPMGVKALFAGHNPHNLASKALLTKLGFRFWREEFYEPTGLMHPSYLLEASGFSACGAQPG